MNTPSVIPSEILYPCSLLFRSGLRHPFLGLGAHADLVLRDLPDPDLLHYGSKEDVAEQRHNDQRQPPTPVAALDVVKCLRRRRKRVGQPLPLRKARDSRGLRSRFVHNFRPPMCMESICP